MPRLPLRRAVLAASLLTAAAAAAQAPSAVNPAMPAPAASLPGVPAVAPVLASAPASASPAVHAVSAAADGGSDEGDDEAADAPDDDSAADEIQKESQDLQAMKQAEQTVTDPGAGTATKLYLGAHRMGGPSALSLGLHDALGDSRAYQPLLPDAAMIDPGLAVAFDIAKAKGEYDIPVELRPEVAQWITFFQRGGRKYFVRWLARSTRYIPVMRDILRQEGLPEDTVYLSMIESGFSTLAYSWAKASGPWQFVEHTGRRYGLRVDFWVDERRDPIKSTRAAARYLRMMHDEFHDWYLAWAGYNAGEGKIRKGLAKYDTRDFWQMCTERRFFRNETKNYVPKLIAAALVTKHPSQFGFTKDEVEWQEPLETEEVQVVNPTDLNVIAKAADCDVEDIKTLNPELRRWLTPPASDDKPYIVRVPKGHKVAFEQNYPKLAPKERLAFRIVRVKRGDTLSKIALANRSFPEAILKMNGLKSVKRLRVGTELMVPVSSEAAIARVEEDVKAGKRKKSYDASDEVPAGTPTGPQQASGTVIHKQVDGKDQVTYGVASGDNLWVISQKFGVTVEELKGWNDLRGKRPKLRIGQSLIVYPRALPPPTATLASAASAPVAVQPAVASAPTPAPTPAVATAAPANSVPDQVSSDGKRKRIVHTLAPGDSLWSLSQRYGVSVDELKKLNHVTRHKKLRAGDTVLIEVAERG